MKPRVGHIKFLNCLPLYFGLGALGKLDAIELISGAPTELNEMILAGKLDISPISSIEYAKHAGELLLLPDISISSNGPVKSIILVSKVPIEKLGKEKVATTTASATSKILLEIILSERYGLSPDFSPSSLSLSEMLEFAAAALLIGDQALSTLLANEGYHLYDLGQEWKDMTGEAMVYAVWAARKDFATKHRHELEPAYRALLDSMEYSLEHIQNISRTASDKSGFSAEFLSDYFTHLRFGFDQDCQRGLRLFFERAQSHGFLSQVPDFNFI